MPPTLATPPIARALILSDGTVVPIGAVAEDQYLRLVGGEMVGDEPKTVIGGGWTFSSTITEADPGAGIFRFDNATQGSATNIFISKNGQSGLNVGALLLALNIGDKILIQELSDDTRTHEVDITGAVVDNTTWVKIPITVLASGSNPLRNNRNCGLIFVTTGGALSAGDSRTLKNVAATGLLTGGELSINGDTTLFDIAAGEGVVVDNHTDPLNPVFTPVIWTAFTGEAVTNILASNTSEIAINAAGAIVQQVGGFSFEQARDLIILGRLVHPDNINVVATLMKPRVAFNRDMDMMDLATIIGSLNASGNVYGPNGVNLNIDKSLGGTFRIGTNYPNSKKSPSVTVDALQSPAGFGYRYQDGVGGWTRADGLTDIVPGQYDDGDGGLAAVPNNDWTIQAIYFFGATGDTFIQYGQKVYNTQLAAEAGITETFEVDPNLAEATFRGFLIVQEGATDLSNAAQATFIAAGVFGLIGGGGGGGGGGSTPIIQDEGTPLAGAPHETVNYAGAGVTVTDLGGGVALVTIPGGGGGGGASEVFSAHDVAGGAVVPRSDATPPADYLDVPLDAETEKTSGFTHTGPSAEVTVVNTGRYVVHGYATTEETSGSVRSQTEMHLAVNGTPEPGTRVCMYNREVNEGCNTGSFAIVLNLTAGDVLKLQVQQTSAAVSVLAMSPNGSGLTIYQPGSDGADGAVGADGAIGPIGPAGVNPFIQYVFDADMLDSVNNADWDVSVNAPAKKDPLNAALRVREYSDGQDEGSGFNAFIPAATGDITVRLRSRGTGGAGSVRPQLRYREIPDNALVETPWNTFVLDDIVFPADTTFQYDEQVISVATLGLTVGSLYQFELVRDSSFVSLVGNWLVLQVHVLTDVLVTAVTRFYAPNLLVPNNADWAVNFRAGEAADSNNAALSVRRFADGPNEECVGFLLFVPDGVTNLEIMFKSRAETGPAGAVTVIPTLYFREIPDAAAVAGWNTPAGFDLTALDFPITAENWHYDSQVIPLATLGMNAGSLYQFEVGRSLTGTLVGDWTLLELAAELS